MRPFLSHPPGRRGNSGLTLIEMIGVLAIIAIVAAIVAPNAVRQIQTATAVGEDAKLDEIANALKAGIEATGLIPNPNLFPTNQDNSGLTTLQRGFGWAYLASNYTKQAGDKLLSSFPGYTNLETYRRMFLSANLAAAALTTDRTTLIANISTNITNWGGTIYPTNAKIFLVSSSLPDLRFTSLSGTNAGDFGCDTNGNPNLQVSGTFWNRGVVTNLESWVKTFVNGVCYTPTNVVQAAWTNKGEFIHIKTVDLSEFFNKAKEAQEKAIAQEDKNLGEIARALVAAIQATGELPNPNVAPFDTGGWASLAQNYTTLTANTVNPPTTANERGTLEYSFPADANGGQTARRVFLDPLLMSNIIANGLNFAGRISSPATGWSSAADSDVPTDGVPDMEEGALRLYIVSSSKSDLPLAAPVNSGAAQPGPAYNSGLISDLLNWQKARTAMNDPVMPGVIRVPDSISQWGQNYDATTFTRGEFLHVKVVDLRSLFCRVELEDFRSPATASITALGSGYTAPLIAFSTNGVTLNIVTSGTNSTNMSLNSVAIVSPPGKNLWENSGNTNSAWSTNISVNTGGGTNGEVRLVFPPAPSFSVGSAPPVTMTNQTVVFYVLKGGQISLSGASKMVQQDSKFQYVNGSWSQVY